MATSVQDFMKVNPQYMGRGNTPVPKGKPTGRGGIATSLISETGGAGGAWAGGAAGAGIGTAIFPGVGTLIGGLIGAGIGGFAGGTGGRALENKVRDDQNFTGEGGSAEAALTEGLISGALGSAGKGVSGLKALKGAKAVGGIDDVAKVAKATQGANPVARTGDKLYRATLGVDDIVSPSKTKPLTIFKADDLVGEARKIGLKGSPSAMQRQVATQYDELSKQVADKLAKSKKTTNALDFFSKANTEVMEKLPLKAEGVATKDELARTLLQLEKLAPNGNINASSINTFKNSLDVDSAFKKISGELTSPLTAKETVDLALWKQADDWITKLAPEAKELTTRQSRLYGLSQGLGRMTRTAGNPTGIGDVGIRAASPAFRSAENRVGGALMGLGDNLSSPKLGMVKPAITGIGSRGIANQMLAPQQPMSLEDSLMESYSPQTGFQEDFTQAEQENPYPRENLLYDIQRDPQNAKDYIEYYQQVQDIFTPQQAKQTASERQRATTAQSGLRSLGTLEETLGRDPSAFQRQALPNPLGITARLTGTSELRASTDNIIDVIARLRSGAAITDSEAARFARLLPQAGDDPEAAQFKLEMVRAELENVIGGGSQEPTLEEILMQRGGF